MAVRALIVAIENYPLAGASGLPETLPGTLRAARDFRAWLEAKWRVEGRTETSVLFCSEPVEPGGNGASRRDIVRALTALRDQGANTTEELFFFFSGHGFSFAETPGARADVLVASDFETAELSGDACLLLDEVIGWLRAHLGPGRHFHFVDACRNRLDGTQVRVGRTLAWRPQVTGEPSTFVLQSVAPGMTAPVAGPFQRELLLGLAGKGRAKAWEPGIADAMVVRFDTLRGQLQAALAAQPPYGHVDGPATERDGRLALIRPVPSVTLCVEIEADAPPRGTITVRTLDDDLSVPIAGRRTTIALRPDEYRVSVALEGATVAPPGRLRAEIYDDTVLSFARVAAPAPAAAPQASRTAASARLDLAVPPSMHLELSNVRSGTLERFDAPRTRSVRPGTYLATWRDREGHLVKRRELTVGAAETTRVGPGRWSRSPPLRSIARHLPKRDGGVDFSESLGGPVLDPDLDLWLAIAGGGRILAGLADYSKIGALPLADFSALPDDTAAIYVLAGIEPDGVDLAVGSTGASGTDWTPARRPDGTRGLFEHVLTGPPGTRLVGLATGADRPVVTVACPALANRATLLTCSLGRDGTLRTALHILPVGGLAGRLPPALRAGLGRNHLRDLMRLAGAVRAFRARRPLSEALSAAEIAALLDGRWADPVGTTLAAYDELRRGRTDRIAGAVAVLTELFPELGDAAALARLAGLRPRPAPRTLPMVTDGMLASRAAERCALLPMSHLDFAAPWTSWRGAVAPPSAQPAPEATRR